MSKLSDSEFSTVNLGDERRNQRVREFADRLLDSPDSSIQSACRGWDETMGAYRFLNNASVDPESILESHREALLERVKLQPPESDLLFIQDTTELDYSSKKQMKGRGPLAKSGENTRQGLFLHNHYVTSEEGLPLGNYGVKVYARDEQTGDGRKSPYEPIEGKESYRWLEGYREGCELAEAFPERQVWVINDREGDIYELFACRQQRLQDGQCAAQLLVRANRDRRLLTTEDKPQEERLYEKIKEGRLLGIIEFEMTSAPPRRKKGFKKSPPRQARTVRQELRVSKLRLRPPYRMGQKLEPLTIWVVLAEEVNPPEGQEPVNWILNTSAPIKTFAQARKLMMLYTRRWQVEVFFRILKTGCRVEELQLKSHQAVLNALMLYLVVAWRIHYLVHLGRGCPELPCSVLFEVHEWRAALAVTRYQQNTKTKKASPVSIPAKEEQPSLAEMLLVVAKLGGYLSRKNDPPPGAQCLWQGMDKVLHYAMAWEAMGHPLD